jgi:flavin-dependent dehydrogenase
MKYDLIIVGGGPAGLVAAQTAADDGLKVLLLERHKDITSTNRTDVSIFYWKFILPDEYIEPIDVTLSTGVPMQAAGPNSIDVSAKFSFTKLGFSVDYRGPVLPYFNYVKMSPSGHRAYCIKNELWGFYFSRECVLRSLHERAQESSAEIVTGAFVTGAANTPDGVSVRVLTGTGEQTLTARKLIVADGIDSKIVESLGLNRGRTERRIKISGYILEGVIPQIPDHGAYFSFDIPSLSLIPVYMGLHAEGGDYNLRHLVCDSTRALDAFMRHPGYADWFREARLVRKTAVGGRLHQPVLRDPVAGNVLVVGDAISQESFIQGAIAGGHQGAKAIAKELDGGPGCREYTAWLHQAFAFFANQGHFKAKQDRHIFTMARPGDDDVDLVYRMMQERGAVGHPAGFVAENPELIASALPEYHGRLKAAIEEINRQAAKGGWG